MTTTNTHQTEITADPEVPLVRIVREFDAPPAKVFRAHADPDLLVQWLGPRGIEAASVSTNCSPADPWPRRRRTSQPSSSRRSEGSSRP